MRKARFTEHQIIAVIKSVKAGRTVKDACREAGVYQAGETNSEFFNRTYRTEIAILDFICSEH